MNNSLVLSDYIVILFYFLLVGSYGYYIYNKKKKGASANTKDFFLAEGSLTWWAIGASLIASNISAEQFIGMSGEGFFVGIAVAAYEWIAAIALIIIAVWFIPIYLKNKIFTMPQFLKQRYNEHCSFNHGNILVISLCICKSNFYFIFRCSCHKRIGRR